MDMTPSPIGPVWPKSIANGWYPVAYSDEVSTNPYAVSLMGHPLVIFRSGSGIAILEDRCPHRNVPLSKGHVESGLIACPYHGWEFAGDGRLTKVPGAPTCPAVTARTFPVLEHLGLIWTTISAAPAPFPALPAAFEDSHYDGFWWHLSASEARMLDAIENLLDPIHSYFLHPGLVRGRGRWNPMRVDFTAGAWGCEARYTEERKALTLLQRLSEGNRTHSYGRYFAPAIVQIAFEDKKGMTATISVIFSPEDENRTRTYAHFSTRKGLAPAWLKRWFIRGFHTAVIAQDRAMLRHQSRTIHHFGGPQFKTGPNDWFGPVIWRLVNAQEQPDEVRTIDLAFDTP
jgi:phenylpropionate dioxygenase-like ring-hydroxylating dioxygenase large terminal subunit